VRGRRTPLGSLLRWSTRIAAETTRLVSDRAKTHRVAVVAVRHANHIGRLGEYTELVAGEGQLAILLVNGEGSFPPVAPFGGTDATADE
jgi:hydroxycarboxylate dehydrogenase B